ncbi:Potassium channel AKT1 [Symbiodinium microadriaticum]|uniref:Potassium channel AKT1 n=2 Tax=Symbiodinium TaxID=2949 RepID=A0A1Q9D541_SYMMI|nr:Potassium channel AKT1 [Symbiodinium microadriaticum]
MVAEEGYDGFLRAELDRLFESLVRQHQAEVDQARRPRLVPEGSKSVGLGHAASGWLSLGSESDAAGPETGASCTSLTSFAKSDASNAAMRNWEALTEKMLTKMNPELEALMLRGPWKVGLQHGHLKRDHTKSFQLSPLPKIHRMRDLETDTASCLQPLVLTPSSKVHILWSLIGSLFIVWDLVTIPLELFDVQAMIEFLVSVGRFSFVYWLIDMPLHMIFAVEVDGHLEMRPRELIRRYLRGWFAIDIIVISIDASLIILQEVQNSEPEGSPIRSARYLRTFRLLRLLRLLRVAKLQQELTLLANHFLSTYAFMVMKIVSGLLMILAVNHVIACCWYGLGKWTLDSSSGSSWLVNANMEEAGFSDSYAVSIHWALTQFTPATNNVAPANALERLFAVLVILLAMGMFSSFISSITATVSTLRQSRSEHFKRHSFLVRFFNERNLSIELFGKVHDVLKKQGSFDLRLKEDEVELLDNVPERLKVYLHEEMFLGSLMSLHCWRGWKKLDDDEDFIRQVCHFAMAEHVATPGQDAFMPGTECSEVYVIEAGSMGYIARQLNSAMAEVESSEQHRGRLTANTGETCYYAGISCEKFAHIVKQHGPPLWQYMQIYGILFIEEIEHMDAEDFFVTDQCLADERMEEIAMRAQRFADMVKAKSGTSFMATLAAMANQAHQWPQSPSAPHSPHSHQHLHSPSKSILDIGSRTKL